MPVEMPRLCCKNTSLQEVLESYGKTGMRSRAVFSSQPIMTFRFCTACPEAPLQTLSMTEMMMARPGMRSGKTLMSVKFDARTCRVCGTPPSGRTLQAARSRQQGTRPTRLLLTVKHVPRAWHATLLQHPAGAERLSP